MKNPITKKQAAAFFFAVCKRMDGFNEVEASWDGARVWLVDSDCGQLQVTVSDDQMILFSIYGHFVGDHSAALARIGAYNMNPHSGKWNIHSEDAAIALEVLDERLLMIGAKP